LRALPTQPALPLARGKKKKKGGGKKKKKKEKKVEKKNKEEKDAIAAFTACALHTLHFRRKKISVN